MKKLFTILGIFLLLAVLAGCTGGGDLVVTPPSFVGVSVDETNPFDGTEYQLYYKEKNESTLIEVVLNNPDNLDIRAIIINGYSYRSNTFIKGEDLNLDDANDNGIPCVPNNEEENFVSTKKKIYFCMSAGETLGQTDYTVDDIEYFDGSDTLDVLVNDNNEFHLYVYKELPTVERENYSLTQESISVDFEVTDDDGVIIPSTLIAKVYLGTEEITSLEQNLNVGINTVLFNTGVMSDTDYEIKIYANYDIDDTTGVHEDVILFSGNFTTLPTLIPNAVISNVMVSSNSVSFDIEYNDVDSVSVPGESRVAIYDGETEVTSVGINGSVVGVTFDDLLNSKQYSIRVISDYDLRNGDGVHTEYVLSQAEFETTAREVPVPIIENILVEENRILFDVIIEDDPLDPIIDIDTLYANVYVDNVLEEVVLISGSEVELQINDVLSGKDVRVEFLATYDLNDGNGPQSDQVIGVFERVSLLNSPPTVDVRNVAVTQGYINIDLTIADISNTLLSSVRAILYRVEEVDGAEVEVYIDTQFLSLDTTVATFAHLVEAESNYRIKLLADYNLLDGAGNRNNQVLYTQEITSLQPKAPAAEIQDPIITNEGLEFDVIVMDADNTVLANSLFIYIYKDGVLQDLLTQPLVVGANHIVYTGLNSDYTYDFEIEADYDILDGSGLQVENVLLEQSLQTAAKELPTASIGAIDSTSESITFDVFVEDIDGVIETGSIYAVLYYNSSPTGLVQPLVVGDNLAVQFTGINSNTPYTVEVIVDYDLDNGEGIVTEYPMTEFNYNTEAKELPVAVIEDIYAGTDTITFDVILTDFDAVLTSPARAVLYIDDVATGQSIDLSVGINSDIQFTNVYSDQPYIIYVIADYDLNDNINIVTDERIAFNYTETMPNEMITGMLYDINVAIESITFSAQIVDNSGVVTTELRAYLYEDGLPTGDFIDLVVGDNIAQTFLNLNSDSLYTIEVTTNYDLGDVTGEQNILLDSFSTETSAYIAPNAYISNVSKTYDSVIFDVTINDSSDTSTGDYKAILYFNDLPTAQEIILSEGLNQLQFFNNLYSGVGYEIRIESIYDLRDGNGVHQEFVESAEFFTTSKKVPVGLAENISVTENQVYFEFDYTDEDNTLIPDTFIAWLYDENLVLIDSVPMSNAEVFFDLSYMPSNYAFTIRVTSDYDLSTGPAIVEDGVILSVDLTTYANAIPSLVISDTQINQTDVTFHLNVTDLDAVLIGDLEVEIVDSLGAPIGSVTVPVQYSEELGYYYNDLVTVAGVTLVEGVLHNVRVVADYNLRDGNLLQADQVIGEDTIIAVNKIIPQAHVYDVVLGTNTIQFDAMIYDNHTAYIGNAQAILYKDGVMVGVPIPLVIGHNDDIVFNVLISDADYQLVITLDYDNLDGNGTISDYVVADEVYHAVAKVVPVADGLVVSTDVDSALLDITVTDDDTVITGNLEAIIYKDGVPAGLAAVPLVVGFNDDELFDLLLSDNGYEARIFADYDLGDGVTVVTGALIGTISFTTDAKALPSAEISNVVANKDTITFDLEVTDTDGVITGAVDIIEVKLYKNNVYTGISVFTDSLIDTLVFPIVDSDSEFRLDVVVDYDLTNGLAVYTDRVLTSAIATTYPNDPATALIAGVLTNHNSITFNVTVTDVDGVIDDNLKAILVLSGVPTGDEHVLSVGSNVGLVFDTDLLSIRNYEILVVADIDWQDGSPLRLSSELASEIALTTETEVPLATFSNQYMENDEIQVDINVWDDTETIVSDLRAEVWVNGAHAGFADVPLVVGDNLATTFTGLDYGVEYEIRVMGTYNDNYGTLDIPDYLIYYELITTVPLIEITNMVNEIFEVNFKVDLNDQFGILSDELLTYYIYDSDDILKATEEIGSSSVVQLFGFYNNHSYRLVIEANVTGEVNPVEIYDDYIDTAARILQSDVMSLLTVTATTISTDVDIELPDATNQVIQNTAVVEAVLYEVIGNVETRIDAVTLTGGLQTVTFIGLDTTTTSYRVVIEGTVNFNDGLGDQLAFEIASGSYINIS